MNIKKCNVCYTNFNKKHELCLKKEHTFCLTCDIKNIENELTNYRRNFICCSGCLLTNDEVYKFIIRFGKPDLLLKFNKWKQMEKLRENVNNRMCPNTECRHIQLGDPKKHDMICEKCNKKYCFEHDLMHNNMTCHQYENEIKNKKLTLSEQYKKRTTEFVKYMFCKECPKCKINIWKNGGCNHMTCSNCRTEFRWCCLTPMYCDCNCSTNSLIIILVMFVVSVMILLIYFNVIKN